MTLEDFIYWGECLECGETMDESEATQCDYCRDWICDRCIDEHQKECQIHADEEIGGYL